MTAASYGRGGGPKRNKEAEKQDRALTRPEGQHIAVKETLEQKFNRLLEEVLAELPQHLTALLEEVPLIVDERPSAEILRGCATRGDSAGFIPAFP